MSEISHLMARQPVKFLARNFRGRHKRLKSGNIWIAEMEVEREVWDTLDTMPDGAMFEVVLWITDGDPLGDEQPEEKPKKLRQLNEHSLYWKEWFKPNADGAACIFNHMLIDALKLDGEPATQETIHDALKAALGVHSLSREVSPQIFETWLHARKLEGLITRSHQITAKLLEQEAKAS